jgi:hypothetical protein
MRLSLIIPAKCPNDPKLKDLLRSINEQDFPKNELEILVISEGTSESAKAIGIRRAKGEVIGILASDNYLTYPRFLRDMTRMFPGCDAGYTEFYHYKRNDNILNRYFALIGANDPLPFYLSKCDRAPHFDRAHRADQEISPWKELPTIGDNGFFIKKSLIEKTDLDNYYHIDNALEALDFKDSNVFLMRADIWHRTGGNIFSFFRKRYRYGLQHAFNPNRRWHLVDFKQPKDVMRLIWFICASLLLVPTFILSVRGFLKIRDLAWFLHPIICLGTLFTYGLLVLHLCFRGLYRSLSALTAGLRV